ncbi:AraC family transcriptional regulator [Oceanobacillus locisalsi]|uniref:AraC family transcriptional regulator n=1 Tax=Oceanobacillus locisalsi TaxID=546107 RepID=A0ABW3NKZ5_9BACI
MRVNFCGYSYHNQLFHTMHKSRYAAYLFRLQIEGKAKIKVNNETHHVEKGDLLIVKPGEAYELHVTGGQQSGDYSLYCEGEEVDQLFRDRPVLSKIAIDHTVLNLWQSLFIEERRPEKEKNNKLTHYLLSALCVALERSLDKKSTDINRPYIVTKMMRYIEENATNQDFMIKDIANYCDMSVSRCVHLFKEYIGQTMVEYAQSIRISTAINQMKYTTMTLENIAQNCGFGSYSYFHRVFKKFQLVSPREYREKMFES